MSDKYGYIGIETLLDFCANTIGHAITPNDFMRLPRVRTLTADRPQGEWIRDRYWSKGIGMGEEYGFFYKCSLCEYEVESGYTRCGFNYCPYCGAKMKGASDDR